MKPDQVTDAMVKTVCEAVGMYAWDGVDQKEIIAAAYNAVTADNEPITAEWLDGMFGECSAWGNWFVKKGLKVRRYKAGRFRFHHIRIGLPIEVKSRRQLLALLEGLGVEVSK